MYIKNNGVNIPISGYDDPLLVSNFKSSRAKENFKLPSLNVGQMSVEYIFLIIGLSCIFVFLALYLKKKYYTNKKH